MGNLEIHVNDITKLHTDAVVNAANSGLREGGGVCGAVFAAAGNRALAAECAKHGSCPTGSAVITSSCGMKNSKYIIHAVGPVYRDGRHGEPEQLYSCYRKALELAGNNGCRSVGFPLISSGIYGYPSAEAWRIALTSCLDFLRENPSSDLQIIFVHLSRGEVSLGKKILSELTETETAL